MKTWIFAAAALALFGCGDVGESSADGRDDVFLVDGKADGFNATTEQTEAVLGLVNTASLEVLDDEVGLDARAASGIVKHRDGADGVPNTADDDLFTTLAELDDVPYVGEKAFAALLEYVGNVAEVVPACFVISEYVEGSGTYNKGIELYNCGAARSTADVGVCLVRNEDTSCTVTRMLGEVEVAGQDVVTLCRTLGGNGEGDPDPEFKARCDMSIGMVATFNGDDRLIVFQDADGDGAFDVSSDRTLDVLGAVKVPLVDEMPWKDVVLRRKKADPFTSLGVRTFDTLNWYTVHPADDFSDFGVAPRFRFL